MVDENMKEELERLKQEIQQMKTDMKDQTKQKIPKGKPSTDFPNAKFNLGKSIENYIGSVMESVASSLESSMGSLFDPKRSKGRKYLRANRKQYSVAPQHLTDFYREGSSLFSIVADENRLKLLKTLERGGKYQKELSELTDIKGGTFNHHIGKLLEMNLVTQEAVRGKYLMSIQGREILKLAEFLFLQRHPEFLDKGGVNGNFPGEDDPQVPSNNIEAHNHSPQLDQTDEKGELDADQNR
ncbi:MAG: ArsR/SmtB family transcription factor [Candidatus Ranarchaeia archaeon]|jgi:DNA-binding transcriptional ArsR family regulator